MTQNTWTADTVLMPVPLKWATQVAEHLAVPAIRRGDLVPLLSDYRAKDDTAIYAVYLSERQLVPRIRAFIDYFVDVFQNPPWHADPSR